MVLCIEWAMLHYNFTTGYRSWTLLVRTLQPEATMDQTEHAALLDFDTLRPPEGSSSFVLIRFFYLNLL